MRTNADYKYIEIDFTSYEPIRRKTGKTLLKCTKKIACMPFKGYVKKAESLLLSYNSERCKLAPLMYYTAKYAKLIRTGEKKLKGISINFKKENIGTERIKNLKGKMKDLHSYFKKQAQIFFTSMIGTAFLVAISTFLGVYLSVAFEKGVFIFLAIFLFSVLLFSIMLCMTISMGSTAKSFEIRLKRAMNEECAKYFDSMYDRLEFVKEEDGKFLYNIKKEKTEEEDMVYYFAGHVFKTNEHRSYMQKSLPSQKDLLIHSTI